MKTPLPIPRRDSATYSTTCWLTNAGQMVKRLGTLRVPSSRTHPVQRIFPLRILFIDLLSFKLETSQVVEVPFSPFPIMSPSAHCLVYSGYSGCPAPTVPLSPLRRLMANVGPPCTPVSHPHYQFDAGPLLSPLPTLTSSHRRYAPHVFRFNGCWSLFRLLLFAFRRFRSFSRSLPVTVPSHRTSSDPLSLVSRCAHFNSAFCSALLAGASLFVVSSQSFSRTALNVSLLRYIAFVFRLLVCLVPSHGGHGHVYQKASRAKVEDIRIISCIPAHYHHSITPMSARHPSCRLTHHLSSPRLRIAYLYR